MNKFESASILAGISPNEEAQALAPTNLHVITGEVVGQSENGKTLVAMDGMVFTGDDSQYVEIDTLGGLEEGDAATILLSGESGQAMTPLAIGSVGSVDRIAKSASDAYDIASSAQGIAQEAKEVAEATGQHVWPDTDGIHVTEVTQDEWNDSTSPNYHSGANVLINALGQLFRDKLNNLLSLVSGTSYSETFTVESYVYDPTYSHMAVHTIGVEHIAIQSVIFDGEEFPKFSATTLRGWVYKKSTNLLSLRFHQSDSALGKQVTVNYRTFASMAIYDGTGNDDENIAASFSADDIMLGGSIDGDVDDDKASIRFFGGSSDTETTYIDASGGISTSSITGDPCYLNREIVLGNIVTDSRLYDDSGRRSNGFVSFDQSISDSYNTAGETTSSYVDSYVSLYSGTNDIANYAAITAKSVDYLLDSTAGDTETYTEVSARADRIRLEDTSGEAIIPMRQAIVGLTQPSGTYTGANNTTTATASGWRITWFNTRMAGTMNNLGENYYTFSNGVVTVLKACVIEFSGVMNWTDSVAGIRGFGIFEGSATAGSGREWSVFQMFPSATNSRKSVVLPPMMLPCTAGKQFAIGRYEQTNAVYVNGNNFSYITIRVVEDRSGNTT